MTTYQENDSERRPYMTMTLACLASQFCTELDPAQPQLIQTISYFFFNKRTTRQRLLLLLLFIVSRSCVHMSEDHSLLSAA